MLLVLSNVVIADDSACSNPVYAHGISHLLPLKYPSDFTHLDYTNPDAPKAGEMRVAQMGTYDNYNSVIEKGRLAMGFEVNGGLVYDRLLEPAIDEAVTHYGRLAEGVVIGPNLEWVAFKLRENATWHDGKPVTVDDVLYTYEAFLEHGSVAIKTALADIGEVFAFGEREVCFVRKKNIEINPTLPFTIGSFSIMPKHYWQSHDISKTTIEAPLGSGPYKLSRAEIGRNLVYERVADYWGQDIPVNKGRYNFDRVKFDYFKDETVMGEAHKSHVFDVREEGVSKNWATQYNFPAVKAGLFTRKLRPLARVEGLWWPIMWNIERPQLRDIRVREALWLLHDFTWTNRVLFYDFYNPGVSYFQNSPMAHQGLPSEKELALLEPWRDQVPPRVFTEPFTVSPSTGFGIQRDNIRHSLELFKQAGWEVVDGIMQNVETSEPFTLDFLGVSYYALRQNLSLFQNLDAVGITSTGYAPEVSNWLHRSRTGAFDGNSIRHEPSNTPGLQLRNWLGSAAADEDYGQNWMRIRNPVIDSLIESVIAADTAEDLYAATRALDRVIMWNFYIIPMGSQPGFRLVHWNKFGEIKREDLSRVPFIDAWWWDEEKSQRVEEGIVELDQ